MPLWPESSRRQCLNTWVCLRSKEATKISDLPTDHNLLTPGLEVQALIFHLNFEGEIQDGQSNLQ